MKTNIVAGLTVSHIGHGLKTANYRGYLLTVCGSRGKWAWSVMTTHGKVETVAKGEVHGTVEQAFAAAKEAATPTCDTCGALLSTIEAAGRLSGTCNACLTKRAQEGAYTVRVATTGELLGTYSDGDDAIRAANEYNRNHSEDGDTWAEPYKVSAWGEAVHTGRSACDVCGTVDYNDRMVASDEHDIGDYTVVCQACYHRLFAEKAAAPTPPYPSFRAQFGRAPIAGDDFAADAPMCADDYGYFTGTGDYSDGANVNDYACEPDQYAYMAKSANIAVDIDAALVEVASELDALAWRLASMQGKATPGAIKPLPGSSWELFSAVQGVTLAVEAAKKKAAEARDFISGHTENAAAR